jgi:hypothetical protein
VASKSVAIGLGGVAIGLGRAKPRGNTIENSNKSSGQNFIDYVQARVSTAFSQHVIGDLTIAVSARLS